MEIIVASFFLASNEATIIVSVKTPLTKPALERRSTPKARMFVRPSVWSRFWGLIIWEKTETGVRRERMENGERRTGQQEVLQEKPDDSLVLKCFEFHFLLPFVIELVCYPVTAPSLYYRFEVFVK